MPDHDCRPSGVGGPGHCGLCGRAFSVDEFVELGRRRAASEILAHARALQSDVDVTRDLQEDPMVGGEVEGLWSAARIADEDTWRRAYEGSAR